MKTKRQNHHRGWKQALGVLLVFALAAGLVLGMPALSGVAYAAPVLQADGDKEGNNELDANPTTVPGMVDLTKTSSITLNFQKNEDGTFAIDLKPEETLVDLYRVAPAVPLSGYNVYAYCIDDSMPYYDSVKTFVTQNTNWHQQEITQAAPAGYPLEGGSKWLLFYYAPEREDNKEPPVSDQEGLVELLAEQYFGKDSTMSLNDPVSEAANVSHLAPYQTTIGKPAGALPAGLYMSVVHGKMKPSDYVVLQPQADAEDSETSEGDSPDGAAADTAAPGKVCTIAYSDTKVYTFQPQLISVPGLLTAQGGATFDTTQAGRWQYAVQAFVKASSTERFADLEITKVLASYGKPVSFVFHVAAYQPEDTAMANPVYEKVIPLTFTTAATQTTAVITGKIPVGSTVVITEEYGGAGYRFSEAEVTTRLNDTPAAGPAPGLADGSTAVNKDAHSVTITNIPAGTIHLTAPSGETKTLPDGTVETVTFTNTHDGTDTGGGAVINSFTQDENNGWTWTRRRYNAATGKWENDTPVPVKQTQEG